MFLINDGANERERRILQFLDTDPPIAVMLAAIHFEWTVKRAILKLSRRPTVTLRGELVRVYGLDGYKKAWSSEVGGESLPNVMGRVYWHRVTVAFTLRNQIVHGAGGCSRVFAEPRVAALLTAAERIREMVSANGLDLFSRLRPRRRS